MLRKVSGEALKGISMNSQKGSNGTRVHRNDLKDQTMTESKEEQMAALIR
jgi:hypothetical protein